ncbi:TPA: hypothetical protein L5Q84_005953 [Pseudomonas aeruginosa]|uniref:hypothetical protein n=2 Tax=Pseudomonas aeruginosa TaxID=287 RepID=UPI000FF74273|nr:hypothetical protein [Pseudomonas aeruginosa]EKQ6344101.1 hypothetical protein [Pseudomonas aeruginosa]MBG6522049.1 hypothetical protein [Pseudomonas aeruginosa]MBH9535676.1 hypothetical protein [Pseudomonas aeruginosa]MBI8941519.1 hypothetical protein [Pseudomonas aeruginosa]MBV5904118.1 hypothetical protein [Pseudomonas aeruginosa]
MDEPLFNELLESVKQADQIMTDHAELRRLAEAAEFGGGAHEDIEFSNQLDFHAACTPAAILALLGEIDRLSDELSACTEHPGGCGYWREAAKRRTEERDQFKEENEALRESLQALIHISDATGWEDHTCGEIAKARAALEGAKP